MGSVEIMIVATATLFISGIVPKLLTRNGDFFRPENIMFLFTTVFILGYWIRFRLSYDDYFQFLNGEVYLKGGIFLSTFAVCSLGAWFMCRYVISNSNIKVGGAIAKIQLSELVFPPWISIAVLSLLVFSLLMAFLVTKTGFDPISNPLMFRIKAGHQYGFVNSFMFLALTLPYYLGVYYLITGRRVSRILFGFYALFTFMVILTLGSRMLILGFFLNTLFLYSFFRKGTVNLKRFIIVFAAVIPMFIVYAVYRDYMGSRGIEGLPLFFGYFLDNWGDIVEHYGLEPLLRFVQIPNFLWVLHYQSAGLLDFKFGSSWLDALLTFVPRALYPDKPLMLSIEIQKLITGAEGVPDLNSGFFFAEHYLNFWYMGAVIYGIFNGVFISLLSFVYERSKTCSSFFFAYFYKDLFWTLYIFWEGFNSAPFQLMLIALMQVLLIYSVFRTIGAISMTARTNDFTGEDC